MKFSLVKQSLSPSDENDDKAIVKPAIAARTMSVTDWSLIIILSLLWGGSFFFVGVAVKELTPFTIVFGRVGLASFVLLAYIYAKGDRMPLSRQIWRDFFIMGVLNNLVPFSLIAWGQGRIESGQASILTAVTPVFSVVLAHFLTKDEPMTKNRGGGVIIGWSGVVVLIGIEAINGSGAVVPGQIAVLIASCSYACAAIFGRRFKGMNPIITATGMLCASSIMIAPIALYVDKPWLLSPSGYTVAALTGLAVVSTSYAYIIYFKVLSSAGATNLLLVTFLIPVSALFLGVVFLGEKPGLNAFTGMLIIFAGLMAIDGRWLRSTDHEREKSGL